MRFLVDANMPRSLTRKLRALGHDVVDIRDVAPPATVDEDIYSLAQREQRVIVTHDLGFGSILAYPPSRHAGIIVMRPKDLTPREVVDLICTFVETTIEDLKGALVTTDKRKVRIRRTP